ncbi:hypothetical protein M8J77_017939 [Diaphorina citri]|nr:hypothetical protein M8J77_017939 [Diaphorina citri]
MASGNTGDRTWGSSAWNLASTEVYGRPSTNLNDFIELTQSDLKDDKYKSGYHASHCMIFAYNDDKIFATYTARANVLMQMRFDGYIGFPGGLVDAGESPLEALNRELNEEINLNPKYKVKDSDLVCIHYSQSKKIILHFYALQVEKTDVLEIEKGALTSHDYGVEVLGTVRVPLYTMGDGFRGLPCFLTHSFIGNAKHQLLAALLKLKILSPEEINQALNAKPVPVKVFIPGVTPKGIVSTESKTS